MLNKYLYSIFLILFIHALLLHEVIAQTNSNWAKGIARSLINCPLQDTIYVDMEIDPQRARSYCCAKVKDKRTGEEKEIVISSDHPKYPKNTPCTYRGPQVCRIIFDDMNDSQLDSINNSGEEPQTLDELNQSESIDYYDATTSSLIQFIKYSVSLFYPQYQHQRNINKSVLNAQAISASGSSGEEVICTGRDDNGGTESISQNPMDNTYVRDGTGYTSPKQVVNPIYGADKKSSINFDEYTYQYKQKEMPTDSTADMYTNTTQTGNVQTHTGTDTNSTERRISHNIDSSLIKRTPTTDRFAWAYKKDQEYTSNPNPSPDLHPKGYVQDDKYIVPIMRQYMETVEASFKGHPTAFDDIIYTEDELRQKEEEKRKEEKSFSELFFDTLARAMAGDSNAKAEFRLLTSNKKSNFKTQSSNLNFKKPESYNYNNNNPSEEIDYKEDILEIENEIALGIAQGALQKATQEALIVKNTASCKEDETASRCMLSKIDKAQRVQREVYIQEISQSPLSSSTKQYLLDIYDGKASPDQNIPLLDEITRYKQWTLDRQSQGIPSKELQARLGAQTQTTQGSEQESLLDKAQKSLQSVFDAVLGWFSS